MPKFLSSTEHNGDIIDINNNSGTAGQILSSLGAGNGIDWIDQGDVVASEADKAKSVILRVKNSTASPMTKGQVVCEAVSATPPSGNLIEVALADNNGTNTMPALGILNEDLDAAGGANDEGDAIMFGKVSGIDTSAFSVGDEVFVDDTPGGLTTTKPTGVKYIQKVGVVIRDDASNGTIEVFGAGRVNDVPTPLYIDHPNQRLGIGTTSPGAKLDVTGDTIFRGELVIDSVSSVVNSKIRQTSSYLEVTGNATTIANGAKIWIGTGQPDQGFYVNALNHSFRDTSSNTRMIINGSSGNVGIGTTSPNYKLDVNGLARFTDTLRVDTTSDTALQLNSTDDGPVYMSYARNGDRHAYVGFGGSSDQFTIMNEETAGRINLGTAGSTRVTILEGGNVGIGTTSPSQKLQVEGNSWIKGIYYDTSGDAGTSGQVLSSTATGTNWITLNDIYYTESEADARFVNVTGDTMTGTLTISNTSPVLILNDTNSSNTTNQIAFISLKNQGSETGWVGFGSGSNSDLTVKNTSGKVVLSGSSGVYIPNGNVGIGTTDPERLLSLYSNNAETTPRFLIEQDGTGDAVMAFSLSGGQGWSMGIDNSLSDSFMIHNSAGGVDSSSQFTINTSGDVGIGTTSPTHKLQVVGNGAFNSTLSVQDPAVSSNGLLQLSHDSTGSSLYSNPASSNVSTVVLRLGINYSEKMRIANNGNVGIGTTSPGEKLDVNGNISHKGLTMTEGTDVDQIKTFTMTYQLAANTWTDTGINSDDLSTGTYIMQVYADDSSAGASHYDEYYSATISWFGTATNSTVVDEIVVHRAGHAPNDSDLQFRTVRHSVGGDDLMLQVKTNNDHTLAMNNTDGRRHTYKFRRLI